MRSSRQRRADTLEKLQTDQDVWVATADARGIAHLVPLSLCWYGEEVIVATEATNRTVRNMAVSGQARLALGPRSDVVIIDAAASILPVASADQALVQAFREQAGWDPSAEEGDNVYLRLRPRRVQAWQSRDEFEGRTIMRDGAWL
jgi:Pyridoxamine 5'-phosphate oxidase